MDFSYFYYFIMDIISTFSFCFIISSLFPVTPFIEILVFFFHYFNKKLLNIVISDPMSINPHVYNLISVIFTITNTIVGNVISFIFVFLGKYIYLHYIFIFLLL